VVAVADSRHRKFLVFLLRFGLLIFLVLEDKVVLYFGVIVTVGRIGFFPYNF
jgi:hypothetical protein